MQTENSSKKLQEDFQRKFTEMDRIAMDKDDTLERVKNGYHEKEGSLQATVQDLQSKLEDCLIRERQLQWANQDAMKEKEIQIENLKEDIQSTKARWDRHVAEISHNHVTQDLELNTALEEQRRLKLELDQRKEDLERYKREKRKRGRQDSFVPQAKRAKQGKKNFKQGKNDFKQGKKDFKQEKKDFKKGHKQ
ncbi:coiled-coil domain-containing protein 57-like [Physella acuta]|uniref:coiled-coil domain-containing protein 57-like n=1 Tax=Physella acuta TaxID=109671 RepID=UPI0027DCD295|nr:coiled-coil domain-containing protein 57-like [Physella acuta]